MEHCYREHFATVERAVGSLLEAADRETLIHEVFSQLLAREELRRSFRGGSFAAWLAAVARNRAIDVRRRITRETGPPAECDDSTGSRDWQEAADARMLVERFRRDYLKPEWWNVFELRFLQRLSQREAAERLSMHRSTVVYREIRIRRQLKRFLLEEEPSPEKDQP